MKVSFIIQDMFARGAQFVTAQMVRGFLERGFEVDLIVSQYHRKFLDEGKTNYFHVPEATNWIVLKYLHARNNLKEIRDYLRNTDSVAVFSMSTGYTHALRIASIGLRRRPKLIHVEHFLAGYDDLGRKAKAPAKWSFNALWRRWYWGGFDRVFVITQEGGKDFVRMNPWYPDSNVRVVNNPAIGEDFWNRINGEAAHPWLKDRDPEWKTFVAADAFVESKGHRYLIEAIKILAQRGEKVRALIFGQGDLEKEYRRMIAENHLEQFVAIGGYSSNIPAELAHAHGYVKTSLVEPFGISLVEGLAAGCRVVSFNCPFGPQEILDNGRYGRLVPVGDCEVLAEAISKASTEERIDPSPEAWSRYTINTTVEKYLNGLK